MVWVTSAYLLAYAVPLLITGRLGDRFGPKRIYLIGLVDLHARLAVVRIAGTLELLIVARAVQGLGAALMTPQTMAVITRTFPPDRRGAAMGLWGATAGRRDPRRPARGRPARRRLRLGVDLLHQRAGRHRRLRVAWIFVPHLPTHAHRFDMPGVVLSAVGLFLIVFGLQEASTTTGAASGGRSPSGC